MYQLRTYTLKDPGKSGLLPQRGLSTTLCELRKIRNGDPRHLDSPRRSRRHSYVLFSFREQDDPATVLAELVKSDDFHADVVDWDDSNILDYTDTFMTPSIASPPR